MRTLARVRFADLMKRVERKATLDDSQAYKCVGVRWYGMGAFVRETLLGAEIIRKQQWIIHSGDVVYNKLFAWKGAFAIADEAVDGCIVSDKFPTYRHNGELLDGRWLEYYFRVPTISQEAETLSKGAAAISKLTLNPPQFWELSIPLPPLIEQQRIVARIDGLAAQIRDARALRQEGIEEAKRLFFAGIEAKLAELEQSRPAQPLRQLVDTRRGISYGIVQTGPPTEDGVPVLRAGDLRWFRCDTTNVKRVSHEVERAHQRTRLRGGEVLLRIRGGFGEVAVCPNGMIGGNVSREIAVIPLVRDLLPEYAMYLMAAPTNQARMFTHVKGTSYVGLNLRDVRELRLPVIPLSEQAQIVADLDALQAQVDALKRLQAEAAAELDALLPSILDKAFKGEL